MVLTSTEVKAYLGISTSVTTYDTLIDYYIPAVTYELAEIAGHRFHDDYHWFWDDGLVITSSNKTITLRSASTENLLEQFSAGDTVDIISSYNNDGYYTISSVTSSHVMVVSENLIAENSTTYDIKTFFYRCRWDRDVKKIAAKMIYWNAKNSSEVTGGIASESIGSFSVSYKDAGGKSYGQYPIGLIDGLKRSATIW